MTTLSNPSEERIWQGWRNPAFVTGALLFIFSLILFYPIVRFVTDEQVDYTLHMEFIIDALYGMPILEFLSKVPHFLYHLLVYLIFRLLPGIGLTECTIVVTLGLYVGTTLITYWLLCRLLGTPKTYREGALYTALTLAIMLLMPIDIFTPENLYAGYIGVNAYHNPTIVVLKPFAVLLFWYANQVFTTSYQPVKFILKCALVTVLCILAKPSYVIALVPALILFTLYRTLRRERVGWMLLVWGILIPAYLILSLQIVLFANSSGFIFAPLAAINSLTRINPDAPLGWPLKLILSILFPLIVYIFNFRKAVRSVYLNLAWLTFIFGAAYMYLLAEGGDRLDHTNFVWSAICALFILFAVSIALLIQQMRERRAAGVTGVQRRDIVSGVILGLHVVSGLYWYYIHVTAIWMGDIIAKKW